MPEGSDTVGLLADNVIVVKTSNPKSSKSFVKRISAFSIKKGIWSANSVESFSVVLIKSVVKKRISRHDLSYY